MEAGSRVEIKNWFGPTVHLPRRIALYYTLGLRGPTAIHIHAFLFLFFILKRFTYLATRLD